MIAQELKVGIPRRVVKVHVSSKLLGNTITVLVLFGLLTYLRDDVSLQMITA